VNDLSALTLVAADAVAPADLHAAFVDAFSDYVAGPFQVPFDQWASLLARGGVDLPASRVAVDAGGRILAFAFAARRPAIGRWRLAAMAARPEARGTGAAPALLDDFIARARAEGVRGLELECFQENERALRLYRGRGFAGVHALNGWSAPAAGRGAGALLPESAQEVAREDAFAWLDDATLRVPDLPLQVTTPSLRAATRPLTAWRSGAAQLVFSVVGDTPIQVHSLIDLHGAQRAAEGLVRALRAAHPDHAVTVPPLQRDDIGGAALRHAGFELSTLNQVLATRAL
jgi:ribosomal protein S18 acetylase RimI-like enzyme